MDEQQFDRLARAVAARRTRRDAMRGLAGAVAALVALARGTGAVAQQGSVPIGGICYHSSQCRDDGDFGPVFCDDNGFAYDGDFNCCRYEGGYCGEFDENCCGGLSCIDAHCSSGSYYRNPGEQCWTEDQCRAASGAWYCADNGFEYDGPLNCCAAEADRCAIDEHCCGLANCIGGLCGYYGPGPGVGLPLGAPCTSSFQCNGGGYGVECLGSFTGPGMTCCLINGQGCGTDSDCCGTDLCIYQSYQAGGRCVQFYGGQCLSDDGCDGSLACIQGYCR